MSEGNQKANAKLQTGVLLLTAWGVFVILRNGVTSDG
jgi:hypothetical protein